MAMYYYASKLSAVACGTRCKQQTRRRSPLKSRDDGSEKIRGGFCSSSGRTVDEDDDNTHENQQRHQLIVEQNLDELLHNKWIKNSSSSMHEMPSTSSAREIQGRFKELTCGENMSAAPPQNESEELASESATIGPFGVMYLEGRILSGLLESLIKVLLPAPSYVGDFDEDYVFSFLLSSRIFIQPNELLGQLIADVPDAVPAMETFVKFLGVWTTKFPYDFRDERIMSHVKHIAAKCANNELNDIVSELLCALLNRLTDLEQHEEDLRASLLPPNNSSDIVQTKWVSSAHLAQLLSRIERKLAKHVGPEEFVQCEGNVLQKRAAVSGESNLPNPSSSTYLGVQGPKKTCNLETYLDWSARLRLLVSNEILTCKGLDDRTKVVELWSGAAQYCLLVGNYNSATAILDALDSPPIARLNTTWSNLPSMSQQLNCMYRHAEGCGDLWTKQTKVSEVCSSSGQLKRKAVNATRTKKAGSAKNSEWVVIPVFMDIVQLSLVAREECSERFSNGYLNVSAFDRLAAIVGAFTKHMSNVTPPQPTVDGEFELIFRQMQNCQLMTDSDLMGASFELEPSPSSSKILTKSQDLP